MTRAIVLIQTEMGAADDVVGAVIASGEFVRVEKLMGPYDAIAHLEADNLEAVWKKVHSHIKNAPGVTRILTCTVVEFD